LHLGLPGYERDMKIKKTLYALIGFATVAYGKRIARRRVRKALRLS